jgi:hypothetical protein
MSRKGIAIVLTLITASALAAGHNRTILIDNFNDGDAEGWEETDFTGGRGVFYVSGGKYQLETIEPIPVDDPSVGTLDADWELSEDAPLFANGTVRGTMRANTDGTTVGFLLRDSHETESDYGFFGSASFGTFYIERFELVAHPEAPQTILAMADPKKFPFKAGETWNLEASVVGHKLSLKAWRVGERKPHRPILTVHDKVLDEDSGSGIAAIAFFDPAPLMADGVENVHVWGTVDNITFTPERKPRDQDDGSRKDGEP